MKKILTPIACFFTFYAYAQTEVKGSITLHDGSPAAFIDILIKKDEKYIDEVSTDENGLYTTLLEDGTYEFFFSDAGVQIAKQNVSFHQDQEIGVLVLPKPENIALKETVITGQKKLIEKKVDRLVFNTDLAEGAKGGNALDALRLAPRIKVDESTDAISIIGKGSISVMINDRLMQMNSDQLASYLKTIRTEDIEKIEVITNPPAKYDATGNSGIVNIVLKNAKSESVNGSLSASYNHQKYGGYNLSGNVNVRKGKWTFTSTVYNGLGKWYNESLTHTYYPDETWSNESYNSNNNKYIGGRIGVDYEINKNLITGFTFDTSNGDGENNGQSTSTIRDLISNAPKKYITNLRDGSFWDWNYIGFNYHVIKKFGTDGKKLTFDFDYSGNNNTSNDQTISNEWDANWNAFPNTYQGNKTYTFSDSDRFNVSVDMEHPVKDWKMNYGTRLRWATDQANNTRYNTSSPETPFMEQPSLFTAFEYRENVNALYYSVEKELSDQWTAKIGLRYEGAIVKGISDQAEENYRKEFHGLYPSAYLMYQAAENHSFSINYSRRVDRPFMWYLNPARVKMNDYAYNEGNPDLTPSNSNNFELEYAYKDVSVSSIYYRNQNDLFEQVQIIDPETKIVINKPFNIGKTYSIGFSENLNIKPLKWWKINASADVFYRKTTGGIPELSYSIDGITGEFRITNNFDLNKKKTLFANYTFNHETKNVYGLDQFGAYSRHNVGFRAMLWDKKLQLSANINNLFENKNSTYRSRSNEIETFGTNTAFRSFRIGIAYNFGKYFNIERSKSNQEQAGGKA
ncbi:outer membrane beta-barrel family protein [Faecalibacter sp. LW9]|uniref:outer membrane beta-barrel family protein n=1 Tax=Faecalibacter sp. LW9 TaxID=3103144 RepID=UPI002AFFF902|nr:outer membrane beta-barrel family protein [Faecalibacter sp. LW9]